MTLGMPWLPEGWTNNQTLGFFRYMWHNWLQRTTASNHPQPGPAPPAAVAAASKIAFSSLGPDALTMFRREDHDKPINEGAPVEPTGSAFLELTESGTLAIPSEIFSFETDNSEVAEMKAVSKLDVNRISTPAQEVTAKNLLNDPERRNLNVRWLRHHFRSLRDVGQLPFHNADMWKLHQYFFSPPYHQSNSSMVETVDQSETERIKPLHHNDEQIFLPEHVNLLKSFAHSVPGTYDDSSHHGTKRATAYSSDHKGTGPASKKAKKIMSRIEYFPRIMVSEDGVYRHEISNILLTNASLHRPSFNHTE
jgi:hypothetical protein